MKVSGECWNACRAVTPNISVTEPHTQRLRKVTAAQRFIAEHESKFARDHLIETPRARSNACKALITKEFRGLDLLIVPAKREQESY